MTTLPIGKGAFIWQPDLAEGGNVDKVVEVATAANFGHVVFKVANDTRPYPFEPVKRALMIAMARALRAAGVQVWGYGYVYGVDPIGEASVAIDQVSELDLDGYYVDAEGEYKDPAKAAAADKFMTRVRTAMVDLPIALCSYRWPSLHPELPWEAFRRLATFDAPQVYWVGAHNPVEQLNRSFSEFSRMTPRLPFVPVGAAYQAGSWSPTPEEWTSFLNRCRELGLSGANFWEWAKTKTYVPQVFAAISAYSWPLSFPPTPLPDEKTQLDRIEAKLVDLDFKVEYISNNTDAILDLVREDMPPPDDGGNPPPDGEPDVPTWDMTVTEDPRTKAFTNFVWKDNSGKLEEQKDGAGKPIMSDYESRTGARLLFNKGDVVRCHQEVTISTGGTRYHKIYKLRGDRDQPLYLLKLHLQKPS